MGFMDELKKLAKPYSEDEDDFDDFDEGTAAPARATGRAARNAAPEQEAPAQPSRRVSTGAANAGVDRNKVVNIHTTAQLQVVLVKPDRFDNVSEIAEHLRDKRAVVLNLESTNKDVARRLVDFLSGCAYALDGKIKKVAISTYIITPYNVDIMGDLIDELENNGLYF